MKLKSRAADICVKFSVSVNVGSQNVDLTRPSCNSVVLSFANEKGWRESKLQPSDSKYVQLLKNAVFFLLQSFFFYFIIFALFVGRMKKQWETQKGIFSHNDVTVASRFKKLITLRNR
jgi:hypothetical protein